MKIKFYQVDAFAQKVFEGNPAAVVPLASWIDDALMQQIAMENNLSETAFFVARDDEYEIRWFTPTCEVDLCGHATLASAYVLFNFLDYEKDTIVFHSKSGPLYVKKDGDLIKMDFPSEPAVLCETPEAIIKAFGKKPVEVLKSVDYIVVFDEDITRLNPNLDALKTLDLRGVCITSKDETYDFVSRFFAPNYGIDEDSVTGSSFTQLIPYWSGKLNKKSFTCKQVSARGGIVKGELKNDRVDVCGYGICCICAEINTEGF